MVSRNRGFLVGMVCRETARLCRVVRQETGGPGDGFLERDLSCLFDRYGNIETGVAVFVGQDPGVFAGFIVSLVVR